MCTFRRYDKIRRAAQKYRVALEVLSYHNTSSEEEVRRCLDEGIPQHVVDIDNYHFNPFAFSDFEKAKYTIYMFIDLFGLHRFDQQSLVRFTLTIKKNYRRVPYHNWTHGFSVANTMYTVIKHSEDAFRPIEVSLAFGSSIDLTTTFFETLFAFLFSNCRRTALGIIHRFTVP